MKNNNAALNTLDSFFEGLWHIVGLAIFIGLAVWIGLLHWYFDVIWITAFKLTSRIFENKNQYLYVIFGLCIFLGLTLSCWLHTWLHLHGRLQVGDQFNRGARLIDSGSHY